MKILYLTNKPVFPTVDGGCKAMLNFLNSLLELYDVKNLTIETQKHPFNKSLFPDVIYKKIQTESVYVDTKVSPLKAFFSLFNKKKSYNISRFHSNAFEVKLSETMSNDVFHVVVLESIFLLPYVDLIRKISEAKIVVRTHNVEHQIWHQFYEFEVNLLKKMYLKKLANDLKRYELNHLNKVDGILTISKADENYFSTNGVCKSIQTIPVSIKVNETHKTNYDKTDFFFLGSMNWKPNFEAANELLKTIFPLILEKNPHAKLHIAGSYMTDEMKNRNCKNVVFHGKVSSVEEFMKNSGILIVPLKMGSGIKVKVVEALSFGVPIVCSDVGVQGIDIEHNKHYLQANTVSEFVSSSILLSRDKQKRIELGKNSVDFVKENFSFDKITCEINEFIKGM
jgi:polysaccharide biosynthesis protein PslH